MVITHAELLTEIEKRLAQVGITIESVKGISFNCSDSCPDGGKGFVLGEISITLSELGPEKRSS